MSGAIPSYRYGAVYTAHARAWRRLALVRGRLFLGDSRQLHAAYDFAAPSLSAGGCVKSSLDFVPMDNKLGVLLLWGVSNRFSIRAPGGAHEVHISANFVALQPYCDAAWGYCCPCWTWSYTAQTYLVTATLAQDDLPGKGLH